MIPLVLFDNPEGNTNIYLLNIIKPHILNNYGQLITIPCVLQKLGTLNNSD